jgi:hypothetical protein
MAARSPARSSAELPQLSKTAPASVQVADPRRSTDVKNVPGSRRRGRLAVPRLRQNAGNSSVRTTSASPCPVEGAPAPPAGQAEDPGKSLLTWPIGALSAPDSA